MARKTPTPATITIWSLIIIGLAIVQFPGILFYHDMAEPRILGMPFIYGFNLLIWFGLCVVLFVAYKTHWGRPRPEEFDEQDAQDARDADEEDSKS